jgi:hypothetical protein
MHTSNQQRQNDFHNNGVEAKSVEAYTNANPSACLTGSQPLNENTVSSLQS